MVLTITFNKVKSIENVLGLNLIDTVFGGIFDYVSLAPGLRSLYLLAIGFYYLSAYAFHGRDIGNLQSANKKIKGKLSFLIV